MNNNIISVIDVAKRVGKRKQTIFKIINKLRITKIRQNNSQHRGQAITYISMQDFEQIIQYLSIRDTKDDSRNEISLIETGKFYLIQLEPMHDPGRFKVGFTSNIKDRLRHIHCASPFAEIIETWQCRRLWEQTAIDCVTSDCEKIHTEVFKTNDINKIINKCRLFFNMMPTINKKETPY